MKKLFTLIIAMCAITAVFAQSGRYDRNSSAYRDNRYNSGDYGHQGYGSGNYDNQRNYDNGYSNWNNNRNYNDRAYDDRNYNGRSSSNWERQQEAERINRDYDSRISDCRNDRSLNSYERNRGIQTYERQRSGQLKGIGAGLIVGGIIALIAGSH